MIFSFITEKKCSATMICLTDKWLHGKNCIQEIKNEKFKMDNDYFNLYRDKR